MMMMTVRIKNIRSQTQTASTMMGKEKAIACLRYCQALAGKNRKTMRVLLMAN
jgi:hypothetical protein